MSFSFCFSLYFEVWGFEGLVCFWLGKGLERGCVKLHYHEMGFLRAHGFS